MNGKDRIPKERQEALKEVEAALKEEVENEVKSRIDRLEERLSGAPPQTPDAPAPAAAAQPTAARVAVKIPYAGTRLVWDDNNEQYVRAGACRPPAAKLAGRQEDEEITVLLDSGTAYPGLPATYLNKKANSSMNVGEMTKSTTVKTSTKENNGVVDLMALPPSAGADN